MVTLVIIGSYHSSRLVEFEDDSGKVYQKHGASKITSYEVYGDTEDEVIKAAFDYQIGAQEGAYCDSDGLDSWSCYCVYDKHTLEEWTGRVDQYVEVVV